MTIIYVILNFSYDIISYKSS